MGDWDVVGVAPASADASDPWKVISVSKPVSTGEALKEGYLSGASANFRDEVKAQSDASGLPEWMGGFRALVGGPKLAYEAITGQPGEATNTYTKSLADIRATQKAAQEQHPVAYGAGEVGGALMLPGGAGAAKAGATLGARAIRSGIVGAGYAGLSGLGAGEDNASRLVQGGQGAVLGGAIGAAGVPVVEGVLQGGKAVLGPIANAVRGAINPETEAARRVAGAIERDIGIAGGSPGLAPQEFRATPDATVMDLGGETTRALARSAANTSPEGRAVLDKTINDRFEGQSGRISDWFNTSFNYPNAKATQDAIEQTARTVNRAAYDRATRDPAAQSLWDEGFQQLTAAPAVRDAIRSATTSSANRAAVEGGRPVANPFQFAADGTMTMRPDISPSLAFWDQVKKNLDGTISKAQRAGDKTLVNEVQPLRTALVSHLDELVPSYQQARAGAAQFFGAENALEAGQNFVAKNFNNGETRQALAQMSPTERKLFQDGFVSRYIDTLNKTSDRRNVLNQIANSPAAKEKLQIALGPQKSAELEAQLRIEGIMDLARGAVQGNSTTARQLAELGIAGGAGAAGVVGGVFNQDPRATAGEAVAAALALGSRGINVQVARKVAGMLASKDPGVISNGVKIIANSGKFLDALRSADRKLAQVGGEQTARVPVPYGGDVVRAEQPDNGGQNQ